MFSDRNFHENKMKALDVISYKVLEHAADGGEFHIRVERRLPMQAPALLKKVLPAETTSVVDERWNLATRNGRVKADTVGVPIEMSCSASIADEKQACVVTYDWEIRARVPLVGGALEKFIASDLDRRLAQEARIAAGFLEPYR
jgi:hypothetical protein